MVRSAGAARDLGDALGVCAYSEETLTACRHYMPVSRHGDFPGAARCQLAVERPAPDYILRIVCRRRPRGLGSDLGPA